jgi:hypothetical protein
MHARADHLLFVSQQLSNNSRYPKGAGIQPEDPGSRCPELAHRSQSATGPSREADGTREIVVGRHLDIFQEKEDVVQMRQRLSMKKRIRDKTYQIH